MKSKHLLVLLAVLAAVIVGVGCSSVTQTPQVKITSVSPLGFGLSLDDTNKVFSLTITMTNYNKVDAVINRGRYIFRGYRDSSGITVPTNVYIPADNFYSCFIPGNSDTTTLKISFYGSYLIYMPVTGSSRSWTIYLSGEDAYGYGKTFADSCRVSF
ncbi:MAG: hypothetical protein EG825_15105 [Rhodocyclaceae bacterium]|nr:hypothetical protein [Rhodocyclaceae bacterium]